MQVKRPKYGNKKVFYDGIMFDSIKEQRRYIELKEFLLSGVICDLRLQVKYDFIYGQKKIFYYKADFVYKCGGIEVVEDVKGFRTPIYRLKKKLIEAQHGIEIVEK